jgi:signal peptidase I
VTTPEIPPPEPAPPEIPRSRLRSIWIRENVEAIAVAIIIALLIRHFCVEAFRIPTGSMEPTLIGLETNGDRILVDKFVYQVRKPRRFEIVVFRYPLDRSRNFVKRLIGLPGEQIDLRDGDVFVNGKIARKPPDLQAEMFANWRVWPLVAGSMREWAASFRREGDGTVAESDDRRSLRLESPSELLLRWTRTATLASSHRLLAVGDRMIRATARLDGFSGKLVLVLEEGDDVFRLEAGQDFDLTHNGRSIAKGSSVYWVGPDRTSTIALSNPDDAVVVSVDGREVVREEYEPTPCDDPERQSIGFGASGGVVHVSDVAIFRDLYYTPDGETSVHVPDDSLYVLGDNSAQSKDSRLWVGRTVTLDDGTTRVVDADARVDPTLVTFRPFAHASPEFNDEFGEPIEIGEGGARYGPREDRPFVPMKSLMGKAFLVFWPPYRNDDGGGWKLNVDFVR